MKFYLVQYFVIKQKVREIGSEISVCSGTPVASIWKGVAFTVLDFVWWNLFKLNGFTGVLRGWLSLIIQSFIFAF